MLLQTVVSDHQIIPLVQGCQRGEASAAEGLYHLYADRIYRYLLARTGDVHTAEDLIGEAFARMIEHIGHFRLNHERPAASFSAWFYRIAANLAADYHRHGRRFEDAEPEDVATTALDPWLAAHHREVSAELSAALDKLTEEQRLVLIGKFAEGMTNRDLAGMLGKSEGAVESMQHRALRRLGQLLGGRRD
jgi:RNA polymerase sigma-70 factor (ECF subfamily)